MWSSAQTAFNAKDRLTSPNWV